MRLCRNPDELDALIRANAPPELVADDFSAAEWLAYPAHFALVDETDLSMFEAQGEWPGDLNAHLFFATRGKQALETARAMLALAFGFGATRVIGAAPTHRRHVLLFVCRLGFVAYGRQGGDTLLALTFDDHLSDLVKSQAVIKDTRAPAQPALPQGIERQPI